MSWFLSPHFSHLFYIPLLTWGWFSLTPLPGFWGDVHPSCLAAELFPTLPVPVSPPEHQSGFQCPFPPFFLDIIGPALLNSKLSAAGAVQSLFLPHPSFVQPWKEKVIFYFSRCFSPHQLSLLSPGDVMSSLILQQLPHSAPPN